MNWTILFFLTFATPWMALANNSRDAELFDLWARIKEPLAGVENPIGFYSAGCLAGAEKLPIDGKGYAAMRLSRNRNWGHPDLVDYVKTLSEKLREQKLPLMLVGDMGPPRGGPMKSGHNSHQIGLDVDIWLKMSAKRPTKRQRESWSAESFVANRKTLRSSWGQQQVKLMIAAANNDRVDRIFISPPIKRYFCQNYPKAPWLYRLRAWWGHDAHLHVRLKCPGGDTACTPQDPINSEDPGCGEELAWWFSKEADEEWQKIVNDPSPRTFPELPTACQDMVKDIGGARVAGRSTSNN